jgi:GYF domain 2
MNAKWYLARPGGAAVGPLRTDVLVRRIREGTVSREALVWCQGMEKWLPLATVKEVADAVLREDAQVDSTTNPKPIVAPAAPQKGRAAQKSREDKPPATARMPFQEEDADEKTELAISQVPPPSSGPTVVVPAAGRSAQSTLAIMPGGSNASGEPWRGPKVSVGSYELPDSVTKIVDPRGAQAAPAFATLPAAGIPVNVVLAASAGASTPAGREPMPTRIATMDPPQPSAPAAGGYPAMPSTPAAGDDELPPPYPAGFPGPGTKPPAPGPAGTSGAASATQDEPVELPIAKSNLTTRLAVALVFILGLALGIFGARRVVMMRQAAQEEKAAETH